jgi:hemolysin activation/secretion protein
MQKDLPDKALDSSEQLFISGGGGVRAYAESESGDNGYVLNVEFRYAVPRLERTV